MLRTMRMAALALAATLAMSGFALAQRDRDYDHDRGDDDGYYGRRGNPNQARQYGYQNGYRDGVNRGRHEGRENDPYDYQTPDWRQATRGYKNWMGPRNRYQRGYQEGYSAGFRSGFESVSGRRGDGDRDDWPYDRRGGYDPNRGGYGGSFAYRVGYEDGSSVAREDIRKRKPYNPNPRGKYDDKDHGYRRDFGSKDQYKAEYSNGYRTGYEAAISPWQKSISEIQRLKAR